MSMHEHQLQVLTVLSEHLPNPHSQAVSTVSGAGEMEIQLPKLRLVLYTMNAMGLIQTDSDLK